MISPQQLLKEYAEGVEKQMSRVNSQAPDYKEMKRQLLIFNTAVRIIDHYSATIIENRSYARKQSQQRTM